MPLSQIEIGTTVCKSVSEAKDELRRLRGIICGLSASLLGLRLREGLHPLDVPPLEAIALQDVVTTGLVATSCGRLQATDDGWFLLDEAVRRLAPGV